MSKLEQAARQAFETWWEREGQGFLFALNTTTDDDIKLVAEVAWKNGAYCAEQAEQEPVAWMEDSIEFYASNRPSNTFTIPLYAAPVRTKDPCNPLQDLTDDEIRFWIGRFPFLLNEESEKWVIGLARVVIAADRAKNNLCERTK